MHKISIIITAYNTEEEYFRECLNSVVNQTIDNFELILVNDGSTNNVDDISKEYQSKYSFIKYIKQSNQGCNAARNNALMVATGEYYCFMDSDDTINDIFLESAYNTAKENDSDITITAVNMPEFSQAKCDIDEITVLPPVQWLIKKSFWDKYPDLRFPTYFFHEADGLLAHKLLCFTNKISKDYKSEYCYRQHDTQYNKNAIKDREKMFKLVNILLAELQQFYDEYNLWEEKKLHLSRYVLFVIVRLYWNAVSTKEQKRELFDKIQKFIKEHKLENPEIKNCSSLNWCMQKFYKAKSYKEFEPVLFLINTKKWITNRLGSYK